MVEGDQPSLRHVPMRRAVAADLPRLLELGRMMHREAHYGAWAEHKVAEAIAGVLDRGLVLVSLGDQAEVVGTVALEPEQPWWSEDWQMADRWFFVHPDWRRTGHARALLRAARVSAEQMGLPLLMAHVGTRARGKMRLFARELGEPVGGIFFHRPPAAGG